MFGNQTGGLRKKLGNITEPRLMQMLYYCFTLLIFKPDYSMNTDSAALFCDFYNYVKPIVKTILRNLSYSRFFGLFCQHMPCWMKFNIVIINGISNLVWMFIVFENCFQYQMWYFLTKGFISLNSGIFRFPAAFVAFKTRSLQKTMV